MAPEQSTPGRSTPGLTTPGMSTPGANTPGSVDAESTSATGVPIDATGTTDIGNVGGDRVTVESVTVTPTQADFDFTVRIDGEAVFDAAQSPGGTAEETFSPSASLDTIVGATESVLSIEVTSASGTGGATTDVTVNTNADDQ